MRVAALFDIHGNVPALKAVLADLADLELDALVVGGDVAEGPQPAETLRLIATVELPLLVLRGNCDRAPSDWVKRQLNETDLDWLGSLPFDRNIDVERLGRIRFCHASPRSDEDVITAISAAERISPMLDGVEEPIIVAGHTHVQFDRAVAGKRLINAGSVGMPYQGVTGQAFWTLLGPDVDPRHSLYDAETFAETLIASGYPHPDWFDPLTANEAAREYEQMVL